MVNEKRKLNYSKKRALLMSQNLWRPKMIDKRAGAPPCGLWLKIGPALALAEIVKDLREIFFVVNNGSAYTRNMHVLEIVGGEATDEEQAGLLLDFARQNGFATLFRGPAKTGKTLGADGVMLADIGDVPAARDLFGADGIVGLHCGVTPERAAAAYDADCDVVMFGTGKPALPSLDALKFWHALTDKPAVIEGPVTNDYCAYYVRAGASFIDATEYLWSHGKGLMQATSNFLHAIESALSEGAVQ